MRIAHISDVHFSKFPWNPFGFFSKRFAGVLNSFLFRRRKHNFQFLDSIPALFDELNVDLVLVAGDLTTTSLSSEFRFAKKFFDRIRQRTIFIPGNHDHYTRGAHRKKRFYSFFTNEKSAASICALDLYTLKNDGVEVHQIQPSLWCVALDTALPTSIRSSNGFFSPEIENNLKKVIDLLPPTDRIILLNHFPFFQNDEPKHCLLGGERLRLFLENVPNISLYLHGHTHRHTIADLQVSGLPLILDSGCPIQKISATWNLIDLSETECTVKKYFWDGALWGATRVQSVKLSRLK